ncbi:receptor-like protein EIX1 [Andrographis paniculata]|uniref:receptor-like protein EIX1 n=1 Tax=Andrographis paniculata TaxID=175694 RepID=UPI0021E6EB25|nr:receptor-like protein EIX1 [Andrographis paniculata]
MECTALLAASAAATSKSSSTSISIIEDIWESFWTERKALLKFKSSLVDPSNKLSSWRGIDCCTWEGITCDEITGYVVKLHIRCVLFSHCLTSESLDPSLLDLKYLNSLDLSGNNFQSSMIPEFLGSMKQLHYQTPCFLQNMTSLRFLDLSHNQYSSWSTHVIRLRHLVDLNLEMNNFDHASYWISKFMSSYCHLESLDLGSNHFHGEISGAFKNISRCSTQNLKYLNLAGNHFNGELPKELDKVKRIRYLGLGNSNISGRIPESLGKLSCLRYLFMGRNMLVGPIPSSFENLKKLRVLDLSGNGLSGNVPFILGQLSNLKSFDISYNFFNGTISEVHFAKLSKLESLHVSNNLINFKFGYSWVPPFQLQSLKIFSNNGGQIPPWRQYQKVLDAVDLNSCGISGTLPKWLGNMNLELLDLSNNHIYGTIPKLSSNLTSLDLSDNILNHLPSNIDRLVPSLESLYLTRNSINGSLPDSLCNMRLRDNHFQGAIPPALCRASQIQILDLGKNNLTGYIPHCVGNFSGITKEDAEVLEYFPKDVIDQVLKGTDMEYYTDRGLEVVNFYLSYNNLVGEIPSELTGLDNLLGLNLSHNSLDREIPSMIGNLTSLESLDLSNNNLVRRIPSSLSNLHFLSRMNLSNNNLSGPIPTGNQLQTLDEPSIYDCNPQLCGDPLLKRCPAKNHQRTSILKMMMEIHGIKYGLVHLL